MSQAHSCYRTCAAEVGPRLLSQVGMHCSRFDQELLLCSSLLCAWLQSDKEILEHIVYNFKDNEMMDALRASIEEAQPIQSPEVGTCSVAVAC